MRDLVARLIAQTGAGHLDADAVALGLIGALEMMWQEIAFKEEENVNRVAARLRCQAYLRSVFPAQFSKWERPHRNLKPAVKRPRGWLCSRRARQQVRLMVPAKCWLPRN
ncbi:MAG: hypothetical protein WDN04_07770 [Rhodospirillales bacterium]